MSRKELLCGFIVLTFLLIIGGCKTGTDATNNDVDSGTGGGSTTNYTIRYDLNGGTGSYTNQTFVAAGSSHTVQSGNGLSKNGYTFNNWNTEASGDGTSYSPGDSLTPTSDVTLYAQWTSSSGGGTSGGSGGSGGSGDSGDSGGSGGSGGSTITEYRIDQPTFGTCSKSGSNITINWTLTTSGMTPNGLYTYTQPDNIIVGVWDEETSTWLEISSNTFLGSRRTFTLTNYTFFATSNNQVGIRVRCTSPYNERSARITYFISADYFFPTYN